MKKNIILIGMPGVGKSTVGVVLAKVMGYQFIDADLVIQEKEGKLLREIIAEVGPEGFLKVENRINSGIEAEHAIIATGGSVVYGAEAMEHLGPDRYGGLSETSVPGIRAQALGHQGERGCLKRRTDTS